jgi:hypothetical protein
MHSVTNPLFILLLRRGTPLRNRLRKRKITASPVTNVEDNPKSISSDTSESTSSSITSKKRRRK